MARTGRRLRRYLVVLQTTRQGARWVKMVEAISKEDARQLACAGPGDMVLTEADARKLAKFLDQAANGEAWGPLAFRVPA